MIAALLLCVAILALLLYLAQIKIKEDETLTKDAPIYSKSLPIIGVTHMWMTNSTKLWERIKIFSDDCVQEGGVIKMYLALLPHYFITDPEDAVTVANSCLEKHFVYDFQQRLFGNSLLGAPVPVWKVHRKLLNPAFGLPMVHGFLECFNDQAKKLIDNISDCAGKGPFKASQHIQDFILRTAFLTIFGVNDVEDENSIKRYGNCFLEFTKLFINRIQLVWQISDVLYKLFGPKWKEDQLIETMMEVSDEIIYKGKKAERNQDLVSDATNDSQAGTGTFLKKYLEINSNNAMTREELREELNLLVAAIFDTSAHAFEYILCLIGSNNEVQEKLFKEVISVIGQQKNVDKEDLQKLVYTEAVVKEALRLIPPVPIVARTIRDNIKLKNCTLRKNTNVIISLYGVNRHASWGPDVDRFRPERWLEPGAQDGQNMLASFSMGKRNCIGKTYAIIALKIYLAHFVRRYRIEADDVTKLQCKYEVFLMPVKGHDISLKLRNTV